MWIQFPVSKLINNPLHLLSLLIKVIFQVEIDSRAHYLVTWFEVYQVLITRRWGHNKLHLHLFLLGTFMEIFNGLRDWPKEEIVYRNFEELCLLFDVEEADGIAEVDFSGWGLDDLVVDD